MNVTSARELDLLAIKHLEFLQTAINRLSHEMFTYKGWAVTLVGAIFVVAVAGGSGLIAAVAMIPIFAFWGLDAGTLRQQRMFRAMFDAVRDGSADAIEGGPLSMDCDPYADQVGAWWRTLISPSVAVPYGLLMLLTWSVLAFTLR